MSSGSDDRDQPKVRPALDFAASQYLQIGSDLRVGRQLAGRPEWWAKAARIREEPTETLLSINLREITGLPLVWIRWAWAMDPSVDIVATDLLGRVHLFEIKKDSVGRQEVKQLEQYMLRHVFGSADHFLDVSWQAHADQGDAKFLLRRVSGVFANERTSTFGREGVIDRLGPDHPDAQFEGGRLSKYRWQRLDYEDQSRRIHSALRETAESDGLVGYPPLESARDLAADISSYFRAATERHHPLARPQRPLVLWLVGRSIMPDALDSVRAWRRAGVDARALQLEIQRADSCWVARVKREDAPKRDALERKAIEVLASRGVAVMRAGFYEETSPSSSRKEGGRILANPSIELDFEGGQSLKLRV